MRIGTSVMLTLAYLCVWPPATAEATTVILDVDFEETSNGNATAVNLNTEVTGGTWAVNDRQESTIRTSSGNKILNLDRGLYSFDLGTFTTAATPLDKLELSYDTYIQRTAGGQNAKKNFFFGTDSGGDEVYRLVLTTDGTGNPTNGRLKYVDAGGSEVTVINGLNSEGGNGITNSRLQNIELIFNATGYEIWVEGNQEVANAPYRNPFASLDGISELSFRGSGAAANNSNTAGAFYDNILLVVAIPEPSTFGLYTLGLLPLGFIGWRRRRR